MEVNPSNNRRAATLARTAPPLSAQIEETQFPLSQGSGPSRAKSPASTLARPDSTPAPECPVRHLDFSQNNIQTPPYTPSGESSKSGGLGGAAGPSQIAPEPPKPQIATADQTTSTPTPSHQTPQTIRRVNFYLQNPNSTLDFNNPLSSQEFKNLSLAQFIARFCEHASILEATLEAVTFIVTFASQQRIVVSKGDDESSWETQKGRIRNLFLNEKEENPKRALFEVYVHAGDRSVAKVVEEDDEW